MKAGALLLVAIVEGVGPAHAADVSAEPLLVGPGADHVVIHGKSGAVTSVELEVREPYAALQTIGFLVETLARRGWHVAMPGSFGPARPSARPRSIAEAHRGIHVWEGRWRNGAGQEIRYTLVYDCPLEQYRMHSAILKAEGYWYDKKQANQREAKRQADRDASCAMLRERIPEFQDPACSK